MSLTFTTADAILKEDYKSPVGEQLNHAHFLATQLEKNSDDVEGRRALHPIHIGRSSGIGMRADGGALPDASNQSWIETFVPLRHSYGRIQISGPIMRAMKSDKGSFLRALKAEMDGIKNDIMKDRNRQTWGTSDGVIAACGVTAAATTVVLATTTTQTQMRQLGAGAGGGMKIDIGTVAAPTTRTTTARTITAYSTANLTITISGAAVTTDADDRVFRAGNGGDSDNTGMPGDGQLELTGLQTIVDSTGYLHGQTAATYDVWAAGEYGNSGTTRAISENLVNTAIMDTETKSGKQVNLLLCSAGVGRAVANLQASLRRNNDTVALKAGYTGVAWSTPGEMADGQTRGLKWEQDCPQNSLYGISTESLVNYHNGDWDWMDEDGAVLSRVSGYDAYEATYFKDDEIACTQRNANFKIVDLIEA